MKIKGEEVTLPVLIRIFFEMLGGNAEPHKEICLLDREKEFYTQLLDQGPKKIAYDSWVIGRLEEIKILANLRSGWCNKPCQSQVTEASLT
ncbi:hypothetical protein IT412_04705 [Candidatus Peregrinibacteria bacterium]|nr:hypothetical protein [Candidatus Peregrinibacteria bacterium]